MESTMSSLLMVLMLAVVGLYALRRKGLLGGMRLPGGASLRRLLRHRLINKSLVEKLEKQKIEEEEKTAELDKVLTAKKALATAKAQNIALRKRISLVSEQNLEGTESEKKHTPRPGGLTR